MKTYEIETIAGVLSGFILVGLLMWTAFVYEVVDFPPNFILSITIGYVGGAALMAWRMIVARERHERESRIERRLHDLVP